MKRIVQLAVGDSDKRVAIECDIIRGIAIHRPFINWVAPGKPDEIETINKGWVCSDPVSGLKLAKTRRKSDARWAAQILQRINQIEPFSELAKRDPRERMTEIIEVMLLPLMDDPSIQVTFTDWDI